RGAALKSLSPVIERRLGDIASAADADLSFDTTTTQIAHAGAPVAKLSPGPDWRSPRVELVGAREASSAGREAARIRLARWFSDHSRNVLGALYHLASVLDGDTLKGAARGAAYQLLESGGVSDRRAAGALHSYSQLSRENRASLSLAGVKAGRI